MHLPTDYSTSQSFNDYLATLGELEVLIDSQGYTHLLVAGGFNVDFNHESHNKPLRLSFIGDYNLSAVDLSFARHVHYTYQSDDDSSITSWIDDVLCDSLFTAFVSEVKRLNVGSNLSDHYYCHRYNRV